MKISHFNLVAIAFIALASLAARTAPATTIYDDSFSRGTSMTPIALNGTSPDVVNTGSATWTAADTGPSSVIYTDGTQVIEGTFTQAFLPFIPSAGYIYTLSADLSINAAFGSSWNALGFSDTEVTGGGAFFVVNTVGPWVIHPGDSVSNPDTSFTGPGAGGTITNFSSIASGYQNYAIVLDTVGAAWTTSFYRNGTLEAGPFTYGTNPSINYVGFGDTNAPGNVENFKLTAQAVPEPSSMALLGLAALGLLWAARRRRAG